MAQDYALGARRTDAGRGAARGALLEAYRRVRAHSLSLAAPLGAEDQAAQAMPDASPTKWHLAHTTWFFETFILTPHLPKYRPFDSAFGYLFNSYYEALGARHPRPQRGLLTRPSVSRVMAYRAHVDTAMAGLLSAEPSPALADLLELGLAHEEQHQELILMDILALFAESPLKPAYATGAPRAQPAKSPARFDRFEGGLVEIGARGPGFAFDNESPRHPVFLQPFELGSRLVTNGEWMEFMAAGGYRRPDFWLSDGWAAVQAGEWEAPLYWERGDGGWRAMSLEGARPVDPAAPVSHVSFFEAAAFAAWAGARLPTEAEWEHAADTSEDLEQLSGHLWQWTASAYAPHPGFNAAAGAVGEYNGKFMVGQMTLKGGACVTPPDHARTSYRNFFYPHQRWMFAGVRLARDVADDGVSADAFRRDVIEGLGAARKRLSAKWLYDAAGSELFERICEVPEYYPTRQETALLAQVASRIAERIPPAAALVELGSGASQKTRRILDAAPQLSTYVPVDISGEALAAASAAIRTDYPKLKVTPLVADFTRPDSWAGVLPDDPRVGFFPGSTIGNLAPQEMVDLLDELRRALGPGAPFILGLDLAKAQETLEAAYDDAAGVTARFNLNLLARINRELDGDFDLSRFVHRAVWNRLEARVEMHLESLEDQEVRAAGRTFRFAAGETIHTESSYKLTPQRFADLAARAGWRIEDLWISPEPQFAVLLLGQNATRA
jgi:dimethylhistidine N-methyltransferase